MSRYGYFFRVFACWVLTTSAAFSQLPKPFSKSHILSYPQDSWGLIKSPVDWNGRSWLVASATSAGILVSFKIDQLVFERVLRNSGNAFHTGLWSGSRHWGDGLYTFPALGLLYLNGMLRDRPQDQLAAMNATKAFVLTRALVQLPKYLFQRPEPGWHPDAEPGRFDGPGGGGRHHSFPSGHVISAFAAASALDASYNRWWVSTLAYSTAATVAVQRIGSGSHWFSDVFTGAMLGYFAGRWIVKKGKTNLTLLPSYQADAGLSLSAGWRF